MRKCGIRDHSDQFPSGVAYSVDNHLAVFPLKSLVVDTVLVFCSCFTVFTADSIADLYLPHVIDNFPVAVAQIIILSVVQGIDLFHHPGDIGIIHIHKQDA